LHEALLYVDKTIFRQERTPPEATSSLSREFI